MTIPLSSFTVNVKNGGASNNMNFSDPANLLPDMFPSGDLKDFLGISAGPNNPIGK
jgi:hypothetical protein